MSFGKAFEFIGYALTFMGVGLGVAHLLFGASEAAMDFGSALMIVGPIVGLLVGVGGNSPTLEKQNV